MRNPLVDEYIEGSDKWPEEMSALRVSLLNCGLTEEIKWRAPCYCHNGKNIVILQEMKDFLALMFFKGALLNDPAGVLTDQGPNSRSARRLELTSVEQITQMSVTITDLIDQAIDVEEAGLTVGPASELVLVEELQNRLDEDAALKAAFAALTPGRQREYNLYFSSAKQAKTRDARIDKHSQKILAGKGLRDRG
ncbi:MAG: YdeI/OmpD-associated family protein [Acidimicrobiaceae bacterium]|nr:YdeI/OmpD-associated family protein [Acidimicrobiaceae bacterium]